MAKAITARRKGDDYQARIFWLYLLQLRTGNSVASVTLESDGVSFVDDVVVAYDQPVKDDVSGQSVARDYLQCKYHVAGNDSFTVDNLLDPTFINTKQSMLKRLYDAYCRLKPQYGVGQFRIFVVSSWKMHPDDGLTRHIGEKAIRPSLYEGGGASDAGKIRSRFARHLEISEEDLKGFLNTVRFQLGGDLCDLRRDLDPQLKLAGLRPIDPAQTGCIYDDLAWKLFGQGRNTFDRQTFDALIREEGLIAPQPTSYSEISIYSRPEFAHRPTDLQAARLDLSDLFDGRFARSPLSWNSEIPDRATTFIRSDALGALPQPIHVFFDCHLSIAYLIGHLMNPKYHIQVIPAHKTRLTGYEFWDEPASSSQQALWSINQIGGDLAEEIVVGLSVTNPVDQHLNGFLEAAQTHNSRPNPFQTPRRHWTTSGGGWKVCLEYGV